MIANEAGEMALGIAAALPRLSGLPAGLANFGCIDALQSNSVSPDHKAVAVSRLCGADHQLRHSLPIYVRYYYRGEHKKGQWDPE
ncbi:MAG: hypothetical protein ACR2PI_13000 [Hyphomicrobiaceae bacterium]